MSLDQTQNFVRATIASAVDSADSTIDVTDSNQLPDPADGEYNLILWDVSTFPRPGQDPSVEVVRATALDESADTLSVDRGQENTAAADHPETAVLQLSPTAKMFADIDSKTSALSEDGQTFAGESADVDDLNNIVFAESGVKSINDALSEAGAGGVVVVKSGTYDEEVTMGQLEQTLIGYNAGNESVRVSPSGSDANALTVTGRGCTIRNIRFDSKDDDVTIDNIFVSFFNNEFHGDPDGNRLMVITGNSTYSRVIGNYANTSDITLESGSEGNVVIGNTRVGTVTDNGTGNEVANNT